MTIYSNALSGLLAAQCGLNVANTNIANLKTEGFSRRGVVFNALQNGGVDTSDAFRYNDSYKDRQLWKANTNLGAHDTAKTYYDRIEVAFGGNASNLPDNLGMQRFFNALRSASTNSANDALRDGVIYAAEGMTQRFNEMLNTMRDQLGMLEHQRTDTAAQITTLVKQIADLNKQIVLAKAGKQDVNATLDARGQAIDALSKLADVQVLDQSNGAADISLTASGQPLVVGDTSATMTVDDDGKDVQRISIRFGPQVFQAQNDRIGGSLGGLYEFETKALRPQIRNLTDLSRQFARQFNAQLAAGYDENGKPGKPLFVFDKATARFTINASVQASDLAFSNDPTQPANTSNLVKLINLKSRRISLAGIGSVAFSGAEAAMIGAIGAQSYKNDTAYATADKVRQQATFAWQSVSGVNYEEEATSLVAYQQMYQANMKCIAVCRELFQAVMQAL